MPSAFQSTRIRLIFPSAGELEQLPPSSLLCVWECGFYIQDCQGTPPHTHTPAGPVMRGHFSHVWRKASHPLESSWLQI